MPDQGVTKLSFQHLQLNIFSEKGVIRVEEENFRLPVDVRGSKTSVLKLSNINWFNPLWICPTLNDDNKLPNWPDNSYQVDISHLSYPRVDIF